MKTFSVITDPDETTHERSITDGFHNFRYTYNDFVNPDCYERESRVGGYTKAYVITHHGYVQAIVFSEYRGYCEQDALDEAVHQGFLDSLQIKEEYLQDYETGYYDDVGSVDSPPRDVQIDGDMTTLLHGGWPVYEGVTYLGNAGEPFDLNGVYIFTVPMSDFSEDPALMTTARVYQRLQDALDEAVSVCEATSIDDLKWLSTRRIKEDLEDALTLCRLIGRP